MIFWKVIEIQVKEGDELIGEDKNSESAVVVQPAPW
jgi:hypothetical protein